MDYLKAPLQFPLQDSILDGLILARTTLVWLLNLYKIDFLSEKGLKLQRLVVMNRPVCFANLVNSGWPWTASMILAGEVA